MNSRTQQKISLIYTVFSCYLFVFMEWLFFITKSSFSDKWTAHENLSVLLIAPLPLIIFSLALFVPAMIILSFTSASKMSFAIAVACFAVPSTILTFLALLMVENFTYTIWQFNIGNFQGIFRYSYLIAIVVFAIWIGRFLWRSGEVLIRGNTGRYLKRLAAALLILSTAFSVIQYAHDDVLGTWEFNKTIREFPNILILSTDGLDASNMSAYGYHRNTTPFIKDLLPQCLLIENHFANNAQSTGSIGALFSGKLPTKTRVIYPPDIFRGKDVYLHMPAILKKLGYRNADFSLRHYTDPYDLNMREGFDFANGRAIGIISKNIGFPDSLKRAFINESYFLEIIFSRLFDRLHHVLAINDMTNPYLTVTNLENADRYFPDSKRIEQLLEFIDTSQTPFFAHVHLMVTHGVKFYPKHRVFSLGKEQNSEWMTDFYDDAILGFDRIVQEVVTHLKKSNLFEKTLIILTSDHGTRWRATERIPLILCFPEQEYSGVRRNNTQRIDLTASLIDYLGVKKPNWIDGESFLDGELEPNRPLFFAASGAWGPMNKGGWRKVASYKPPYYSLGGAGLIIGQKWFLLNLQSRQFLSGVINDHTSPIDSEYFPSVNHAYDLIIDHLQKNKYPTEMFSAGRKKLD